MTKQNFIISRLLRSGLLIERMSQGGTLSPEVKRCIDNLAAIYDYTEALCAGEEELHTYIEQERAKHSKDLLEMETTDFDLSVRAINALRSIGVFTIGDLCSKTRLDIMRSRNLGVKSLKEIDYFMDQHGLTFKPLED